jgi:hypothetical protein
MLTGYEDELCRYDEHLTTVSSLVLVEFPQKEREYRNKTHTHTHTHRDAPQFGNLF